MVNRLWILVSHCPLSYPSHSISPSLPLSLHVQSRQPMSEVVVRYVFLTLTHSVACLHSMMDPQCTWKHLFITDQLEPKLDSNIAVIPIPEDVVPFSVAVMTQKDTPPHYNCCPVEYTSFQSELLHMIGAILSSSEVISGAVPEPIVCRITCIIVCANSTMGMR